MLPFRVAPLLALCLIGAILPSAMAIDNDGGALRLTPTAVGAGASILQRPSSATGYSRRLLSRSFGRRKARRSGNKANKRDAAGNSKDAKGNAADAKGDKADASSDTADFITDRRRSLLESAGAEEEYDHVEWSALNSEQQAEALDALDALKSDLDSSMLADSRVDQSKISVIDAAIDAVPAEKLVDSYNPDIDRVAQWKELTGDNKQQYHALIDEAKAGMESYDDLSDEDKQAYEMMVRELMYMLKAMMTEDMVQEKVDAIDAAAAAYPGDADDTDRLMDWLDLVGMLKDAFDNQLDAAMDEQDAGDDVADAQADYQDFKDYIERSGPIDYDAYQ